MFKDDSKYLDVKFVFFSIIMTRTRQNLSQFRTIHLAVIFQRIYAFEESAIVAAENYGETEVFPSFRLQRCPRIWNMVEQFKFGPMWLTLKSDQKESFV